MAGSYNAANAYFGAVPRYALLASACAMALGLPGHSFAQATTQDVPPEDIAQPAPEATEDTATGNEIIVTATKREQTLQDVPVAVSVASAEAIERAQIRDVRDLQSLVPSLRVAQTQAIFATTYSIRGFGSSGNNAGLEPSVGMFVDGVYRSRSVGQVSDLADLQRVEVLRGPQSTLFGKNASAGVISIVTKEPQYDFGGNVEASYGNYDAMVLRGYVTGPVSDSAAASLSAGYNRRDGYITDLGYDGKSNNRDRWFARGQLKIEPNSQMRVRLIADYDRIAEICCSVSNFRSAIPGATQAILAMGGMVNDPAEPFADIVYSSRPSKNVIDSYGLSGQVDYDIGPLRVTSITALRKTRSDSDHDADFTSGDIVATNRNLLDIKTFTQEMRVSTNLDGSFNFLLGGYYFNEKAFHSQDLRFGSQFRTYADLITNGGITQLEQSLHYAPGTFQGAGQGLYEDFHLNNEAWSIFGDVDVQLARHLTLTLGLNYTHDAKDVVSSSRSTDVFSSLSLPPNLSALADLQFVPPFLDFPNAVEGGRTRDGNWSNTVRLAYEFSDTLNAYVARSTGFKASSFNLSRDSRPTAADLVLLQAADLATPNLSSGSRFAKPEKSELYELGVKGNWGIASANFTVFKQSIKNFQANLFLGTGFALSNAEKQSTFGVEFDGMVKPLPELSLTMAVTYLDPRYDTFRLSPLGDQSGDRITTIPQISATWGAQWDQPLANDDHIVARVDFHYESEVTPVMGFTKFIGTLPGGGPDYAPAKLAAMPFRHDVNDLNASLTYALRGGLELTVWGRNLLNDRYVTDMFDSVAQPRALSGYVNKPRTYGVSGRYRF